MSHVGALLPGPPGMELRLFDVRHMPAAAPQSGQERLRAARFLFDRHRHRYLAGRFALRCILSDWTGIPAPALRFAEYGRGKPMLLDRPEIRFNLSYADENVLIGVSAKSDLGVDIERRRPFPDARALAEDCFDGEEQAALHATSSARDESDLFLCGWTRKEAAFKAAALGIVDDPASIATGIEPAYRELPIGGCLRAGVSTMVTDRHMISWAAIL
ncbi:4'-phosphopantetheinyl transferase family protein [Sphingobium bisphenolivorans]|uniref:4'-phosphopantetheinyl transferase family protein n=1 Tax=Sphingobium bisphenolivorans TaxID=1335760 RepID=UPI0003A6FD40|nr:4'-phosphopantetheinyl transferase superfamily protein [Sphingobium bisphenolivorans]